MVPLRFCVLCLMLVACGDDDVLELDSGSADVDVVETGSLTVLSETTLALREGETADIRVLYADAMGVPIANAPVRFALDGTANDSTLATIEPLTDANGEATTQIVAGEVPGTFRVRASTMDAPPVFVNVSISDVGFARIEYSPTYGGERDGQIGVSIVTASTCEDERAAVERTRYRALGDEEESVLFVALPAGVPLVVVARLDGSDNTLLAWACQDDVVLEPDETRQLSGELIDFPLNASGAYATTLAFDVGGVGESASSSILELATPERTANRLLDAVEEVLESSGQSVALAAFQRERSMGLSELYSALLRDESVGLTVALGSLAEELGAELIKVSLEAELRIGEEASLATQALSVGEDPRPINLERTGLEAPVELRANVQEGGEGLDVERLTVVLRGGALSRALMRRAANEAGFETATEWLQTLARCESIPSPSTDFCDGECIREACGAVVESSVTELDSIYSQLDEEWPEIRLAGELTLSETSGDLSPDEVDGRLEGAWTTGEPVEAELEGERIRPPS